MTMTGVTQFGAVQCGTCSSAPTDGTSGTGAGVLAPGSLLIDTVNSVIYINSGTKASPVFSIVSLASVSSAELAFLDGVSVGVVAASKAVVANADKDAGDFRNLDCVNLDAGKSGAAGSVDVFPATAESGKLAITCTNQAGDTTVSVVADAMAAARTIHLPDPGKTSYLMQSSAQITCAEADVLDAVTPGTAAASKAVVLNSDGHIDAVKTAALSLGASGAETLITATAAQLNSLGSAAAGLAAILAAGLGGAHAVAKTEAATTTVIAANATKARACLVVVHVDETYDVGTGTLPTVAIGEDDTVEKCMAASVLTTQAAGTVLVYAFTNAANKKIIVTSTAAVGDSTGGCTVTVLAIPTT